MTVNGSDEKSTAAADLDAAAAATSKAEPTAEGSGESELPRREAAEPAKAESKTGTAVTESSGGSRSVSFSVRSLGVGAFTAVLIAAVATLGWLYYSARNQLHAQSMKAASEAHAEKIALDYAVSAATMDYKDLQKWKVKLVQGTSPELSDKLTKAGTSMEQVLVPLQWSSSARPLLAKVRSDVGGVYIVDSFVSVDTKTIQAPEPLQSTATYSTTIDSNNNWVITDVGGIGSALESK